jgi:hypothetical protein
MGSSSGGAGVSSAQPNRATYNNPPVFFSHDLEIEEATPSVSEINFRDFFQSGCYFDLIC